MPLELEARRLDELESSPVSSTTTGVDLREPFPRVLEDELRLLEGDHLRGELVMSSVGPPCGCELFDERGLELFPGIFVMVFAKSSEREDEESLARALALLELELEEEELDDDPSAPQRPLCSPPEFLRLLLTSETMAASSRSDKEISGSASSCGSRDEGDVAFEALIELGELDREI